MHRPGKATHDGGEFDNAEPAALKAVRIPDPVAVARRLAATPA